MSTVEKVYGLKINSRGYKMVQEGMKIAMNESVDNAKIFLTHQFLFLKLKYWEKVAIADCFIKLIRDLNRITINK